MRRQLRQASSLAARHQCRVGKFSYALLRIGDFTGYGIAPALGGYNPDLIGGGTRSVSVHDFRLEGIETNPGGKVALGLDLSRKNNRDGQSTSTVEITQPADLVLRFTKTLT